MKKIIPAVTALALVLMAVSVIAADNGTTKTARQQAVKQCVQKNKAARDQFQSAMKKARQDYLAALKLARLAKSKDQAKAAREAYRLASHAAQAAFKAARVNCKPSPSVPVPILP